MVLCATDWWGLTQADEAYAATVVANLDGFGVIVDRLQQAVLNTLFLGRLMINPQGLAANPAFQVAGRPVIDTSQLYYDGNSQGGIMGGVLAAVSPDVRRAVLGVTGMDYGNLLLARSTDFTSFSQLLEALLPRPFDVSGGARSDRPAVGSRRPGRLRAIHPAPAARHAVPPGADAGRLRRLPGEHVRRRRRGADDRRARVSAGAGLRRSRAIATCSGASLRSAASRTTARRSRSGTAARGASSRRRSGTSRRSRVRRTSTRTRTRATRRRRSSRSRTSSRRTGR